MTKILITGANGQLGSELRNLLDERGVAYDAFDSKGKQSITIRLGAVDQSPYTEDIRFSTGGFLYGREA